MNEPWRSLLTFGATTIGWVILACALRNILYRFSKLSAKQIPYISYGIGGLVTAIVAYLLVNEVAAIGLMIAPCVVLTVHNFRKDKEEE